MAVSAAGFPVPTTWREVFADAEHTAIIIMDHQPYIMRRNSGELAAEMLARSARVLARARKEGILICHVNVRFSACVAGGRGCVWLPCQRGRRAARAPGAGHPEISPASKFQAPLKASGSLVDGTPDAGFCAEVAPLAGEPVFIKRRVGAFSSTDLECVLRARGVRHLVLFGHSTGGCVLSTTRAAADNDYLITVFADCCSDGTRAVACARGCCVVVSGGGGHMHRRGRSRARS